MAFLKNSRTAKGYKMKISSLSQPLGYSHYCYVSLELFQADFYLYISIYECLKFVCTNAIIWHTALCPLFLK